MQKDSFSTLFRKYRLKSEFETLHEFGNALADINFIFEDSLFSHWQKGTRIPKDRRVICAMISIFLNNTGMHTVHEANQFMEAAGLGFLTESEIKKLPFKNLKQIPFEAPRIPDNFIKREKITNEILKNIAEHNVTIIYGQSGTGKTALATYIAHLCQDNFNDGVIWVHCNSLKPLSILHSVMQSYDETLPLQARLEEVINLYRTYIANKNALFVFDDIPPDLPLESILPNSSQSSVIVTTSSLVNEAQTISKVFTVMPFSNKELKQFIKASIPLRLRKHNETLLLSIINNQDNLPLLAQIITKQYNSISPVKISDLLQSKSIQSSLTLCYNNLSEQEKNILDSCTQFEENSFTIQCIAFLHKLSKKKTSKSLENLVSLSFIQKKNEEYLSLHPIILSFLNNRLDHSKYLQRLAEYYILFIDQYKDSREYFKKLAPEVQTIVSTLRNCLEKKHYDIASKLWQSFRTYYWHVGAWKDFSDLSNTFLKLARKRDDKPLELSILLEEASRLYYYDGNIKKAILKSIEAAEVSKKTKNTFYIALAHQRYGKLCFINNELDKGFKNLSISKKLFTLLDEYEHLSHNARYESEGYLMRKDYFQAHQCLEVALANINKISNKTRKNIYACVIYSHFGILQFLQDNFEEAKHFFLLGLQNDKKEPLVRGTYTWLNKLGLAITYSRLGFTVEGNNFYHDARRQMEMLGIEKSFHLINVYAQYLSREL